MIPIGHPHQHYKGDVYTPLLLSSFWHPPRDGLVRPMVDLAMDARAVWAGDVPFDHYPLPLTVLYKRLRDNALFARPVSEWTATVEHEGRTAPRFAVIEVVGLWELLLKFGCALGLDFPTGAQVPVTIAVPEHIVGDAFVLTMLDGRPQVIGTADGLRALLAERDRLRAELEAAKAAIKDAHECVFGERSDTPCDHCVAAARARGDIE